MCLLQRDCHLGELYYNIAASYRLYSGTFTRILSAAQNIDSESIAVNIASQFLICNVYMLCVRVLQLYIVPVSNLQCIHALYEGIAVIHRAGFYMPHALCVERKSVHLVEFYYGLLIIVLMFLFSILNYSFICSKP